MTPGQAKASHVSLRIGLALVCLLAGLVFPIFFWGAALLGGTLFFDLFPSKHTQHEKLKPLTEQDDGWREAFHDFCESPAEVAFLDAMIDEFKLTPKEGRLIGSEIELNLQVSVSNYRLDFLANERLIIEIDGARWHSSPEAQARDKARDKFFLAAGYEVIRIPAKYPLYVPQEATRQVREACVRLKENNKELSSARRQEFHPKAVWSALVKGLDDFGKGISAATTYVNEQAEKQKVEDARRAKEEHEKAMREIQAELDADEDLAAMFKNLQREFK